MEKETDKKQSFPWGKVSRYAGIILKYAMLIVFSLLVLIPLLWVGMSSLKSQAEINNNIFGFPAKLHFQNYVNAWNRANMGSYFGHSVFMTAGSLALLIVLAVPCSYTLSRFKFRGRGAIRLIFMSGLFININYIVVPLYLMIFGAGQVIGVGTGLTNNYFTVALLYATTSLSFSIYLMNSYFAGLSPSFEEAAKIDGCGYFKTFLYICAPLALPSILTVILFNFLSYWNEYLLAFNFLSTDRWTLPVGLLGIMRQSKAEDDLGRMYAGLMLVMVPVLLVYACVQGQLTKGVTVGGVKG